MTEPTPCSKYRRPLVPSREERRPTCLRARPTSEWWEALQGWAPTRAQAAFWGARTQDSGGHLTKEVLLEAIRLVEQDPGTPISSLGPILPRWPTQDR